MRGSFYGWYFKCQSAAQTLAVIPADAFRKKGKTISIGRNRFGEKGIYLEIHTPKLTAKGRLDFGPLSPLKYDIMGPFALVPFMECRHSVWSMRHAVSGSVWMNGNEYLFRAAL